MATIVPISNPQRSFQVWSLPQIYTGPNVAGAYVPNVGDLIVDLLNGFNQVTSVDYTTGLSVWVPWIPPNQNNGVLQSDVLLGSAPGAPSESYRCYINTSVTPYSLNFDTALYIYSSKAAYCKVFLGTDISSAGIVISAQVDQNNNVTTENLSLSVVQMANANNLAISNINGGVSTQAVQSGELVTAVIYAADGTVLSYSKLLVSNTNFSRPLNAATKYVTGIELVSDYLSSSNSQLLEIPVNMLTQSILLQGKVLYSDGSSVILPIDGTRFNLAGMNNYVASTVGQQVPLVLIYNFASNEYGYEVSGVYPNRFMTADYTITTMAVAGAYSVKIYAVPRWNASTNQYTLSFFMYNLNRNAVYDVTPYVTMVSPNVFNPAAYNTAQTIAIRLNLNQVAPSFAYYIQNQTLTLDLESNGSAPAWWVQYSPSGPQMGVGNNYVAKISSTGVANTWNVDLSCGLTNSSTWVNALYNNAQPLYDPVSEAAAPTPNYVRVIIGTSYTAIIPITSFNTVIPALVLTPPDPIQGDVVLLEFLYRSGSNPDQELGLGVLPIQIQ